MGAPVRLETRCGACLLYSAIEGMADGLILVGQDGRVFHINRRGQQILGTQPRQSAGARIDALLRQPQLAALWAAAEGEHDPVTSEIILPSGNSLQATISSCLSAEGEPIGRMIVLRDTTREKKIQIELASSVAERLMQITAEAQPPQAELPLTSREQQIIQLLVEGLSNAQMAGRLHVSLNTIASHLKNIYAKLNVSSRAQAVALAVSLGLRPPAGDHRIG